VAHPIGNLDDDHLGIEAADAEARGMGRFRRTRRAALIAPAIVADLLALWVWGARPTRVYSDWLGLVGRPEAAPLRRLRSWSEGERAPWTPAGLLSLFRPTELLMAVALLASLVALVLLLSAPWLGRRRGAWLAAPVRAPHLRWRVRTALLATAILGVFLGWEIVAWRTWRLRTGYLQRAYQCAEMESRYESWRREDEKRLAKIEALPAAAWGFATHTDVARAAARAASRDRLRRNSAYAAAMSAAYARLRRKYEHAADHPREPVSPDPPLPNLEPEAGEWLSRRDYARALAAFGEELRRYPDLAEAHERLAWIWATCPVGRFRDGLRAVESATRACELTNGKEGYILETLAAAYAEAGDFAAAVRWQRKALEQFAASGFASKVPHDRLDLYLAGKPYRHRR
jgi:tetratricopeptide (TPR) repeat protein